MEHLCFSLISKILVYLNYRDDGKIKYLFKLGIFKIKTEILSSNLFNKKMNVKTNFLAHSILRERNLCFIFLEFLLDLFSLQSFLIFLEN